MDMNVEVEPDWGIPPFGSTLASDQGAALGFCRHGAPASRRRGGGAGQLEGDGFGGGPSVPMLPGTWEPDQPDLDDGTDRG